MVLISSLCVTCKASTHAKHINKYVNIDRDLVTKLKSHDHINKCN